MNKKPLLFSLVAILTICALFFFGRTVPKSTTDNKKASPTAEASLFDIQQHITEAKSTLTAEQAIYVSKLENNITRGDVASQQITAYKRLADFWKDSISSLEPYAYYTSEWAKLDNSEKNLTFAARLFLDNLRAEHDLAKLNWKATSAITLFEKALLLNPDNTDLKIGLGSSYIFGMGQSGKPEEMMSGIQQLLSVVRQDSTNMRAQFVLGVGGLLSRQYDKAIERFTKVVQAEPGNLEAVAFLADTYAAKGDKPNAVKWYEISKRLVNDPAYSKEVDERMKLLK